MSETVLNAARNVHRAPVPVVIEDAIPADQADPPIDFEAAVLKLWAGRKTILLAGLGAMLLATIIAFLIPPSFVSVVSFLRRVRQARSNASAPDGPALARFPVWAGEAASWEVPRLPPTSTSASSRATRSPVNSQHLTSSVSTRSKKKARRKSSWPHTPLLTWGSKTPSSPSRVTSASRARAPGYGQRLF